MKIIDIRAKHISNEEALKDSHARFHLDIKEIAKEEVKKLPSYEIEVGRKEKSGWIKGIKQIHFSFTTHFGLKRYRIKTSFILSCILIFFFIGGLASAGNILTLKQNLLHKGQLLALDPSPQNFFSASLTIKDAKKDLAILGEIPEFFSQKAKTLTIGSAWAEFFLRASGYYNPRYYLVLFENNSEIRATGGFIGSYALLKVDKGSIEIKKMEGVFNVSGQQRIGVIPPDPIKKISTSWSFHDANWFFDFPSSAKAISWFYEKSEGPTVDGIIALTPEFVRTILTITGPITLPSFQITLNSQNVIDTLQYEIEEAYTKRGIEDPKTILKDATPILLQKIIQLPNEKILLSLFESLKRKEILFYFSRPEEEALINYYNAGGSLLKTDNDYLAVVNSNINGYKTDRVVVQSVKHQSEILSDGSIKDTLTIRRNHTGGENFYEWYNKVNSDFLRVYVPKGSRLLSVKGQTIESDNIPTDYRALRFIDYPQIKKIRENQIIDEKTTTYIFEENEKTVFGNWIYVSPGEHVEVTYTYLLPFKARLHSHNALISLTVQKQPGITYTFDHTIVAPRDWYKIWQSPPSPLIDQDRIYASIFSL